MTLSASVTSASRYSRTSTTNLARALAEMPLAKRSNCPDAAAEAVLVVIPPSPVHASDLYPVRELTRFVEVGQGGEQIARGQVPRGPEMIMRSITSSSSLSVPD
jgi:hypothetical protein